LERTEEEQQADDHVLMDSLLTSLPVPERVVVALLLAGFKQIEVGVIIGMTRAAIGAIYKRAITRLKEREDE